MREGERERKTVRTNKRERERESKMTNGTVSDPDDDLDQNDEWIEREDEKEDG